jgi:hypothetical protein
MGTLFSIIFVVEETVPVTDYARRLSSLRISFEQTEERSIQPSA